MRLAGAIIALIAGIFATFAAGFTLFVGGVGGALRTDSAGLVIALGWGGVAFSFLTIVFGAIGIGNKSRTPGFLLILSSLGGAILGGTFVAIFMVLALIGGILVAVGGRVVSSPKSVASPKAVVTDRSCVKCSSSVAMGQAFCGKCGTPAAELDEEVFFPSATAEKAGASVSPATRSARTAQATHGKNWLAWIGGAAVVGLVGLFGMLALNAGGAGSGASEVSAQPAVVLGQEFRLGDFSVVLSKAEIAQAVGVSPFTQKPSPTSVYLVVEYSYRNDGTRPMGIFETPRLSLRDEQGVLYSPDIGAGAAHATEASSNAKILSNVNPGVTVTESDVFEINASRAQTSNYFVVIAAGSLEMSVPVLSKAEGPPAQSQGAGSTPPFVELGLTTDVVQTSAGALQFSTISNQHRDEVDEDSLFGKVTVASAYDFGDGVVLAILEKTTGGNIGSEYYVHRISAASDEVVLATVGVEAKNLTPDLIWQVKAWGWVSDSQRAGWTCLFAFDPVSRRPIRGDLDPSSDPVSPDVCAIGSASEPANDRSGVTPDDTSSPAIPDAAKLAMERASAAVITAYKAGGIARVVSDIDDCYSHAVEKIDYCGRLDFAGRYLDWFVASELGTPQSEFFSNTSVATRILRANPDKSMSREKAHAYVNAFNADINATMESLLAREMPIGPR